MRKTRSWIAMRLAAAFFLFGGGPAHAWTGYDVGESAAVAWDEMIRPLDFSPAAGTWLRVRELAQATDAAAVRREKSALRELRRRGFRICALVEWPNDAWSKGVRSGPARRYPVDLREAWEKSRDLARTYGEFVDVWEIGNEPDVSFIEDNAENYAAYFKACRAGLRAGADGHGAAGKKARVLMAPLALPPGPFFERLWESGVGEATDGFNFHYYGYAEDFSDVYGQFRDAVERSGAIANPGAPLGEKTLPVFLTEYGYGLMSIEAGASKEGRLRQWRWFRDVGRQLDEHRPESAFAFLLRPYSEQGLNEFGLLARPRKGQPRAERVFSSRDFPGETEEAVWLKRIGDRTKAGTVTPALAWLERGEAGAGREAIPWQARVAADARGLVVDFVARDGLEQRKSFQGYFACGIASDGASAGWGELVIYNFSDVAVSGVLRFGEGLTQADDGGRENALTLASGERRVVPVRVKLPADVFKATRGESIFETADGERSRIVTTLWPDPARMTARVEFDFSTAPVAGEKAFERLRDRPLAGEEPALRRQGRWLVSNGTTVIEQEGRWRFVVDALPAEPLRPAMAELVLPDGFTFAPGMLLEMKYRLGHEQPETRAELDVYFRTANGNLFQVWPRLEADREWRGYAEAAENFTMAFFGRAKLPWRFLENRPVALVFFLRPKRVPEVFEIERAAITRRVTE